jgi:Ni,Fe-hydrogenase III component G
MEESLSVQSELMKSFSGVVGNIRVPRPRRIFAQVPYDRFAEVFENIVERMGFSILCAITALDGGAFIEIIYHLARPSGVVLNLSTSVPKDRPVVKTISGRFPAADLYEREMVDLMGVQVEGLPPGNRYPLPDDWPAGQYPLRKDWKRPETATPDKANQEQRHV